MICTLEFYSVHFKTTFTCTQCDGRLNLVCLPTGYEPLTLECVKCHATHPVIARCDIHPADIPFLELRPPEHETQDTQNPTPGGP